ncbi:MAG TPA: hypothetical protein DCM07_15095 [Planctomycetaceae bacterium]|nr:hypothetical protein [Gimesia sp.]HAH46147.1 hypothetical protein [Planctomycetaceae bacterium]HBL44442.1 hypothetical protein [Planctomycetaceae bacterium]
MTLLQDKRKKQYAPINIKNNARAKSILAARIKRILDSAQCIFQHRLSYEFFFITQYFPHKYVVKLIHIYAGLFFKVFNYIGL